MTVRWKIEIFKVFQKYSSTMDPSRRNSLLSKYCIVPNYSSLDLEELTFAFENFLPIGIYVYLIDRKEYFCELMPLKSSIGVRPKPSVREAHRSIGFSFSPPRRPHPHMSIPFALALSVHNNITADRPHIPIYISKTHHSF